MNEMKILNSALEHFIQNLFFFLSLNLLITFKFNFSNNLLGKASSALCIQILHKFKFGYF